MTLPRLPAVGEGTGEGRVPLNSEACFAWPDVFAASVGIWRLPTQTPWRESRSPLPSSQDSTFGSFFFSFFVFIVMFC